VFLTSVEAFFAQRSYRWLRPVVGLSVLPFTVLPLMSKQWTLAVVMVVFWLLLDGVLRLSLPGKRPIATVDAQGIASYLFGKKQPMHPWQDIVDAEAYLQRGQPMLKLRLRPKPDRLDKRSFWNGKNPCEVNLALAMLTLADRAKLLAAVQRQRSPHPDAWPQPNPLQQEHEFAESLKALAPVPWACHVIAAICVLVWLAMVARGVSPLTPDVSQLLAWGGSSASEVQKGQAWRLMSAMFLHGSVLHLVLNMVGLYSVGPTMERVYGRLAFFVIYGISGLAGGALSLHFSGQHSVTVGASGAIFGLAGCLLAAVLQHRSRLPQMFRKQMIGSMGLFIAYSLVNGFSRQGIDNAAHIGGLLAGASLALVLPERFDLSHHAKVWRTRLPVAVMAGLSVVGALAAKAPAARVDLAQKLAMERTLVDTLKEWQALNGAMAAAQHEVQAQRLDAWVLDRRTRDVYAPQALQITEAFRRIDLPPGDPREQLVKLLLRQTELTHELLVMDSVPGADGKPTPADPVRANAMTVELTAVMGQLEKSTRPLKPQGGGKQ
jgi:rhomboid protease GluP